MATHVSAAYTWPATGTPVTTAHLGTWLQRMYDAVTGVGLVQASDTGQYVPFTTTWPAGLGTLVTGYYMFRFNDALQSTSPIFMKIRIGSGGNYNQNRQGQIQFGTGTNGTGTLTGTLSNMYTFSEASGPANLTALQEYASYSDSAFFWGSGYAAQFSMFEWLLSVERFRDPLSGVLTGDGFSILYAVSGNNVLRAQSVRVTAPIKVGTAHNSYCLMPGTPANPVNLAGDKLLYPHFYEAPDIRQRWSSFTARNSDFSASPTSFVATPVVADGPRTFVSMGSVSGNQLTANMSDTAGFGPMFRWE